MPYRKVLVVEDDPHIRSLVSDCLREEGLEVEAVGDGEEARACLQREPDLLVLLDWLLPHDGSAVVQWLQANHHGRQHRVVVLSASTRSQAVQPLIEAGIVQAFLPKPFNLDALLRVVQQLAA
jgi:CheY-like chemotaxis protein